MKVSHILKCDGIFVCMRCAESVEDTQELRTLIGETRALEQIIGKKGNTGLYFLEEVVIEGKVCAVFSLHQKLERTLYPEERKDLFSEMKKSS